MASSIWQWGRRPDPTPADRSAALGGPNPNTAWPTALDISQDEMQRGWLPREDRPMTEPQPQPPVDDWPEESQAAPGDRPPPQHAAAPETERFDRRPDCPHCLGTGKTLTANDKLRQSLALFPVEDAAAMDGIVAGFYARLVARDQTGGPGGGPKPLGEQLAPLFPHDLTTGPAPNSRGNPQRDMLLHALVAMIEEYDPDNPTSQGMQVREQELLRAGRSHSSFRRPDGSERPPSAAEYAEVFDVLAGLLHEAFGDKWLPEYDELWAEAYDDAVVVMRYAGREHQRETGGRLVGRMPRQAR